MRSGRPSYHIKANFISIFNVSTGTMIYFNLDNKGNLIKDEKGQFLSHIESVNMINNNLMINNKTNANPIIANSVNIEKNDKPTNKENEIIEDNRIKEPPPNDTTEEEFDETINIFENDLDIFDLNNDTDFIFENDNIFDFWEDQPLDII